MILGWLLMLEKFLDNLKDEGPILPNQFTAIVGDRIRKARQEANMSQAELAHKAHFRQSSISKIEMGTQAVSAEQILYLSHALDKPINYFYPPEFTHELGEAELTVLEKELFFLVSRLDREDLRRLIAQVRGLVENR